MGEVEKATEYLLQISNSDNEEHIETILEVLDLDILTLRENNRLLENGSKQLCEEIKRLVEERELLINSLKYIIGQYEADYTEEELLELEPRDDSIYNNAMKTLNVIDI